MRSTLTGTSVSPFTSAGVAATLNGKVAPSVPYSKTAWVGALRARTRPPIRVLMVESATASPVTAIGGSGLVVKVPSPPKVVPRLLEATSR